jgi:hypothetical protein
MFHQPLHQDIPATTMSAVHQSVPEIGHKVTHRNERLRAAADKLGWKWNDDNQKYDEVWAEEEEPQYQVNDNPFLQGLTKPGSVIFALKDTRDLLCYVEGKKDLQTVSIKAGHWLCFPGNFIHCGKTCPCSEFPPWKFVIHFFIDSIFHPRNAEEFDFATGAIGVAQPEHLGALHAKNHVEAVKEQFKHLRKFVEESQKDKKKPSKQVIAQVRKGAKELLRTCDALEGAAEEEVSEDSDEKAGARKRSQDSEEEDHEGSNSSAKPPGKKQKT